MSDLYIPNAAIPNEEPGSFKVAVIYRDYDGKLYVSGSANERIEAIVVPEHGRLIEKGKTLDACYTHYEDFMLGRIDGEAALLNIECEIRAAPTIIPASRKKGE